MLRSSSSCPLPYVATLASCCRCNMSGGCEGAVKSVCASRAVVRTGGQRAHSAESRGANDEPRGFVQTATSLPSHRRVVAYAGVREHLHAVGAQQHPCRLPPWSSPARPWPAWPRLSSCPATSAGPPVSWPEGSAPGAALWAFADSRLLRPTRYMMNAIAAATAMRRMVPRLIAHAFRRSAVRLNESIANGREDAV